MNILILGAGQVGSSTATQLAKEEDNEVTVVDIDPEKLTKLGSRVDLQTIEGNAAYPEILKQSGAETADILIAVTSSDEVNMIACQIASTLFNTPKKIARIRAQEYSENRRFSRNPTYRLIITSTQNNWCRNTSLNSFFTQGHSRFWILPMGWFVWLGFGQNNKAF